MPCRCGGVIERQKRETVGYCRVLCSCAGPTTVRVRRWAVGNIGGGGREELGGRVVMLVVVMVVVVIGVRGENDGEHIYIANYHSYKCVTDCSLLKEERVTYCELFKE